MDKQELRERQEIRDQAELLLQVLGEQRARLVKLARADQREQRVIMGQLAQAEIQVLQAIRGLAVLMGQPERVV